MPRGIPAPRRQRSAAEPPDSFPSPSPIPHSPPSTPALAAPPDVVSLTTAYCREVRDRRLPPTARSLLLAFRQDLGVVGLADSETLDFEIIPNAPVRSAA